MPRTTRIINPKRIEFNASLTTHNRFTRRFRVAQQDDNGLVLGEFLDMLLDGMDELEKIKKAGKK